MMNGKVFLLCLLLSSGWCLAAAEPFVLPKEALILNRDDSGKTWALNGAMKKPLAETRRELTAAVTRSGYRFKHEIPVDAKGAEHLILSFVKGNETLIVMLWAIDGKNTFFSYGVERK